MKKLGVALSGGGIKSFSQVPILKAMLERHININYISGTSMGSVIAALYASGMSIDELSIEILELEKIIVDRKLFRKISPKLLPFSKERIKGGFIDGEILEELIIELFQRQGVKMMSDVKIPLAIPAVDIISGRLVVFVSHPEKFKALDDSWIIISDAELSKAVRASCSFPLVIGGLEMEDMMLIDGGVMMNLPLQLLEAYNAETTVGITMHSCEVYDSESNFFTLVTRILDIQRKQMDQELLSKADLIINVPLDNVQIFDVGRGLDSFIEGQRVVKQGINDLENLVYKKPWYKSLFKSS